MRAFSVPGSFSHRFYFGGPNLMTVAPMGFFFFLKKTRSPSSDASKIPDDEFPVRSFASDAQTIGVQRL